MAYVPPFKRALHQEINNDRKYVTIPFSKTYNLCTHEVGQPWNGERFGEAVFSIDGESMKSFANSMQVPFHIQGSSENNIWCAELLHIDMASTATKVTSVHSLMNCFFGEAGSRIGSITFAFDDGSSFVEEVVVGKNVRDYYQGLRYTATVSDPSVTEVMAPSAPTWLRLDMQTWIFPTEYQGKGLCGISVESTGREPIGKLFIAGLTATVLQEE